MARESDIRRRSGEIRQFFRTQSNKTVVSQFLVDAKAEIPDYEAEIDRLNAARFTLENERYCSKRIAEL